MEHIPGIHAGTPVPVEHQDPEWDPYDNPKPLRPEDWDDMLSVLLGLAALVAGTAVALKGLVAYLGHG